MKVIIEDGLQTIGRPTGIGTYTSRLRNALLRCTDSGSPSPDVQVTFNQNSFFARVPNRLAGRLLYLGWISSFAEPVFRARGADVVHITANYTAPFKLAKPKLVFTIHDLTPFKAPDTLPKKLGSTPKWVIRHAVSKADVIITPTETVKHEILEYFPAVAQEDIITCHHGIEPMNGKYQAVRRKNSGQYFLFVGTLEKRKNVSSLISAFARLAKRRKNTGLKLLLVGKPGFGFDEIEKTMHTENVSDSVSITGYVEEPELAELYASATALVMPSLYEGFGIPLIEAMAFGTAVIASDIPVFREVAENAALYYGNPTDVEGLTNALEQILDNETLRTRLIQAGKRRVTDFTLHQMAKNHIAAYTKALET